MRDLGLDLGGGLRGALRSCLRIGLEVDCDGGSDVRFELVVDGGFVIFVEADLNEGSVGCLEGRFG